MRTLNMKKWIIVGCAVLTMNSVTAQDSNMKVEADSAYLNGNYSTAIELYENLLQKGESDELYYNLGNAYYKSDELAKAILNYERALLVNPGFSDAKANLKIARAKTIDKELEQPEIFFIAWIKQAMHGFSMNVWATCGIIAFLILIVALGLFFFSKAMFWKKTGFFAGLVSLIMTLIFNLFAASLKSDLTHRDKAIVLTPSITVRSTPSENGTSLFILHEGHKVVIKDNSMRDWKEISIENDKVGWVPAESIEVI